jgi:hypothetical protein
MRNLNRDQIVEFLKRNLIAVLIVGVVLFAGASFGLYQLFATEKCVVTEEETDLIFDPEGVYALLLPRKDGNALNLNIKRTAKYKAINYELAYRADSDTVANNESLVEGEGDAGIDRGVVGDIQIDPTGEKLQPEYNQEILFGTCSKNVCKYDKGVENGTLTIHLTNNCGNKQRVTTSWKIQNLDVEGGKVSSGDEHFRYEVASDSAKTAEENREELVRVGYSLVNEVTGAPKLPNGRSVFEKVYAVNVPEAKTLPKGSVRIETAENPPADAKIAVYIETENAWRELDTKIEGSTLTTEAPQSGIFAVLVNEK